MRVRSAGRKIPAGLYLFPGCSSRNGRVNLHLPETAYVCDVPLHSGFRCIQAAIAGRYIIRVYVFVLSCESASRPTCY